MPPRRRARLIFSIILFAALIAVGCTRVQLAYNTAGLAIELYAGSYLSLDGAQLAEWRPSLTATLARHRRDELPYLAAFFDTAWREADQGLTAVSTTCLFERLDTLYDRHARMVTGLAAPLLATLTPTQLRELERRLAEEAADEAARATAERTARSARKRAERYAESAEWWIGPLTEPQRRLIGEVAAEMPASGALWSAYRRGKQAELLGLLARGADEAEVRRFLDDWLVAGLDLPPELRRAGEGIRTGLSRLFVELDATLSPDQRGYFIRRLRSLRDDFMALQAQPRLAATIACR